MTPSIDCRTRSFWWLNATQFLGALNDNLFKLLVVFFLVGRAGSGATGPLVAVAGAVFVAPFLLFSGAAGTLADRISKRRILVALKGVEVGTMALGALAFWAGAPWGLYTVLFAMASQSAFFGPAKYGAVPELVGRTDLARANGALSAATQLAVVTGTAAAPLLLGAMHGSHSLVAGVCVAVAVAGWATSRGIATTVPAGGTARASWLPGADPVRTLWSLRADRHLLLALAGAALFSFAGAFLQLNLVPYGVEALGLSETGSGYLFLVAAVGVGAGSWLAGRLSGRGIELGVVPLGAAGLAVGSLALGMLPARFAVAVPVLLGLGASCGLFIVPVQAFLQIRSPADRRGAVLAASNFVSWAAVLGASGLLYSLTARWGFTPRQACLVLGGLALALAGGTLTVLPDFLLRFVARLGVRCLYRVRVSGPGALPAEGPGVVAANHVSYLDALVLLATGQRRIRFLMAREIYDRSWVRPFCRLGGVIPISPADGPRAVEASLEAAREALRQGYLVGLFPEGRLSRDGALGPFKAGLERIARGAGAPIVPVHLGGLWGSAFSHAGPGLLRGWRGEWRRPVSVRFGRALPSDTPAAAVGAAVASLATGGEPPGGNRPTPNGCTQQTPAVALP